MYTKDVKPRPIESGKIYRLTKSLQCKEGVFDKGSVVFVEEGAAIAENIFKTTGALGYSVTDGKNTDYVICTNTEEGWKEFASHFELDTTLSASRRNIKELYRNKENKSDRRFEILESCCHWTALITGVASMACVCTNVTASSFTSPGVILAIVLGAVMLLSIIASMIIPTVSEEVALNIRVKGNIAMDDALKKANKQCEYIKNTTRLQKQIL